jgi:flagellar biosynthesis protein FlhF
MQVRTFEAVDMKQALQLVKKEMGPRAVIVASRSVRKDGGLFGLLGRKVLEVTAAAEDGTEAELPAPSAPPGTAHAGIARLGGRRGSNVYNEIRAVKQAVDPVLDEVRSIRESVAALDPQRSPASEDLRADIAQIRTLLSSLVGSGLLGPDAEGAAAQKLYYFLLARGIDDPLARSLVQRVVSRVDSGALGDIERLKLNLAAEMRHDLARAARGSPPSRVQIFVGPTGVGKTTTVAKLAARAAQGSPEGALLVTTDVHRVAAVEQMMRFGDMLNIPVEVAISAEDLSRALGRSDRRVFIDTAGRSHRDPVTVRALKTLIDAAGDAEVMLVLSATTRAADSREILATYMQLPCSRLILTKLDETRVYGELFNCVVRSGRPLACVSTGQAVPQHLESLDAPGILRKVLHG